MERQFPKNVKQIGNVSDNPKIYVEDYADTFLNQICHHQEEAAGAFLVGEQVMIDSQPCVFIYGAVRMPEVPMNGTSLEISDEFVQRIREEKEKHFQEGEIVGWFLALPGQKAELNENIRKIHEKTFPKTNTIFIIRDTVAKEEMFFAYKYHDLLEIGGHYIYYEKNSAMQNYMIFTHKQNGVTPSEVVADRAAKDFRSLVRDRMEKQEKKKGNRLSYVASTALILIAIVIGISLVNNYDKMKTVQNSIAALSRAVDEKNTDDSSGETAVQNEQTAEELASADSPQSAETEAAAPETEQEAVPVSGEIVQPETVPETLGEGDAADPASAPTEDPGQAVGTSENAEALLSESDYYIVQKGDTLLLP